MKECPYCNEQNEDDVAICFNCGSNLDNDDEITVSDVDDFFSELLPDTLEEDLKKGVDEYFDNLNEEVEENENNETDEELNKESEEIIENSNHVDELIIPPKFLESLKEKSIEVGTKIIDENLSKEDATYIKQKGAELSSTAEDYIEIGSEFVGEVNNKIKRIKNNNIERREEKQERKYEEYEEIARQYGINTDIYFLTNVKKHNMTGSIGRKNTWIDGFFGIEEGKFVFKEIGVRKWKKTIVASLNIYFEHVVSLRVIRSLDDDTSFEDITKVTATSLHDYKQVLKTLGENIKSLRFKEFITPTDNKGMFNVLLINLVDNDYYEIRLPNLEIGENIELLFDILKKLQKNQQTINTELTDAEQLEKIGNLYKENLLTEDEYKTMKKKIIEK